ncbi:hypothetical protein ACNI3R_03820 [Rhizorhabdus sp. FW153]
MIAILSTAGLVLAAPAYANPEQRAQKPPLTLDYHLPEVKIGLAVSHMISACPNGGANLSGFAMDTVTQIKPVYVRGTRIRINPKGNLFVDRQVKLEFHEGGTLKSFNGASTGQGGKIVAAAIKAASFGATLSAGAGFAALAEPSIPPSIQCKEEVLTLLRQKKMLEATLASLRQMLLNEGPSENLLLQITRTEAAIDDAAAGLTIDSTPVIWTPSAARVAPPDPAPADLTKWFKPDPRIDWAKAFADVGLGQVHAFKAEATYLTASDATPTTTAEGGPKIYRALVYREPGVVDVKLRPLNDFQPGNLDTEAAVLARAAYEQTKVKATVKVPQIGTLKTIPFDGSGIFGSRAVAATFDQMGELTSIGYTSTGGADALAGVVDASVAAGIELRDSKTNAIKREVERRTQANALEALIEAEAKKDEERAAGAGL